MFHNIGEWRDGWYVVPYDVTLRDLDPFNHVNNAIYLTYFEWARTQYWLRITGGSKPSDINFIVARAEIDFRRQVALERIHIATRIAEMRGSSFDFVYEVRKEDGQGLAATGKVVVVLYDWQQQTKVTRSEELRGRIRAFQKEE